MSESSITGILQAIYDAHGTLTPELVVKVAEDPSHPLHHRFEWDDAKAGPLYRLEQGSHLIRSARVVYKEATTPQTLRAFVSLRSPDTPKSEYRPVREVMEDPLLREIALRAMRREWQTLRRRYEHMSEFAEMVQRDLAGTAS